jgi:hypothetical protein
VIEKTGKLARKKGAFYAFCGYFFEAARPGGGCAPTAQPPTEPP